ncbi:virion protein [Photobacterium halotolerans]|uniref:Virion protein n=1 Tax=Photobacterium halotolerans TaxID=265726 RepID=A0A7X4WCA2_9GAMM|nr:virion protein [Photobacterium halotolerans]NAW66147.1 virion protein [Photobacterium halotolerans]
MSYKATLPRGVRNNNPVNIEYNQANDWEGQKGSDGRFVIFSNPAYGFRAGARVLRSYYRQGYRTLSQMINRFAPSHENNTSAYVNNVSKWTGIGVNDAVDVTDANQLANLLHAMARMEVGQYYSLNMAQKGVAMA